MQTTTPRLIRADFRAQIKAVIPSHPEHRECRYRYVASVDDVPGPDLRIFHIDIPSPAQPVTDGIYGSGVEHQFDLRVWVSYGALAPDDDDSIITTDGAQIWHALQRRYDPGLAGLISVEPTGWTDADDDGDESGRRWGFFSFDVRYLQDV